MFNTESRYGLKDVMLTELYEKLFNAKLQLDKLNDVCSITISGEKLDNTYSSDILILETQIALLDELICIRTNELRGK